RDQHHPVADSGRDLDPGLAIPRIPGLRVNAQPRGARELQDRSDDAEPAGAVLLQRIRVFHERRSRAHRLFRHGALRYWNGLYETANERIILMPEIVPDAGGDIVDLTIPIPCLNEKQHIGATLETGATAMKALPYRYEVLVIDDGSTDNTAAVVEQFCQAHPELPIRLHRNQQNRGLTRSYVDGAFLGRGQYYRLVCGDNVESVETLVTVFRE